MNVQILVAVVLTICSPLTALHASGTKPNVLLIITDDQGWNDPA